MAKTLLRIALFPLAALVLGAIWQTLHPEGPWTLRPAAEESGDGFMRVSWDEARPRVEAGEWLLIDARPEGQFAARHLPGSVSLPADAFPEFLEFFVAEHGTERTAVIYCASSDCDTSVGLAARLRNESDWPDVRILEGGFLEWLRHQP